MCLHGSFSLLSFAQRIVLPDVHSEESAFCHMPIVLLMLVTSIIHAICNMGRPLLRNPGRGGIVWGPGQPRPTHPPTHPPTSEKFSSGKKLKFIKRAGSLWPILGRPTFWGALTHPHLPGGGGGTRPWWLALLACGGAYWPLAFEPSDMTSRHPYYCGHPHCRGHPYSWVGIQNATSAHGVLP